MKWHPVRESNPSLRLERPLFLTDKLTGYKFLSTLGTLTPLVSYPDLYGHDDPSSASVYSSALAFRSILLFVPTHRDFYSTVS